MSPLSPEIRKKVIIDLEALAKRGDNAPGSIRLLVCLSLRPPLFRLFDHLPQFSRQEPRLGWDFASRP